MKNHKANRFWHFRDTLSEMPRTQPAQQAAAKYPSRKGGMPPVRTFAAFKRMLGIFYLYAAKLIEPPAKKQLPPAPKALRLQTQTKD